MPETRAMIPDGFTFLVEVSAWWALRERNAGFIVSKQDKVAAGGRASAMIGAPPERIWELVSDVTRTGEWSPENTGGIWLEGAAGPVVGARFRGTNRRGRARWATSCEVVAAVPGREFAFVTGTAAKPKTLWRYILEPTGDGTRVTESFEFVKPVGAVSRLVTRVTTGVRDRRADLEENVRSSLVNLKQIVED